jgi:membrane-associated phospholipid phosphatase
VFGLAVAGFLDVAEDVRMHETAAFDDAVRGWVLTHQTPLLHALFHGVTWLGSAPVVAVLAVALTGSLWLRRRRVAAEAVGSAALAAAVLVAVLKPLIGRLRPPGAGLVGTLTYSFPSGHATATTALLVVAAYVLSRERLVSRQVAAASLLLPTAVGVSRVYLDVHWATDVLGGWAAGTVLALVAAALYERLRAGRREVGSYPDVSARSCDVLDSGRQ